MNQGAIYVGVTPAGDIAVVSGNGVQNNAQLFICNVAPLTGNLQVIGQTIVENSFHCSFGQITAMDIRVEFAVNQGFGGGFPDILQFAPVHIPSAGRISNVCQQSQVFY